MDEPGVALGGTEWALVEVAGAPVEVAEDGTVPHPVLDLEEAQVAGSTGCNRLAGAFALSETSCTSARWRRPAWPASTK